MEFFEESLISYIVSTEIFSLHCPNLPRTVKADEAEAEGVYFY
jgi:hypothetical protein